MRGATNPAWRLMRPEDVPDIMALAGIAHPALFERPAVILDRMALFPEGALVADEPGVPAGLAAYALAYPAPRRDPPPLDTVLGRLSGEADALYLHDLVVAPSWRGRDLARPAIERLLALADARFATATLVSVYGTAPFWTRFGFRCSTDLPSGKLASYGDEAIFMVRRSRPPGRDRPGPEG